MLTQMDWGATVRPEWCRQNVFSPRSSNAPFVNSATRFLRAANRSSNQARSQIKTENEVFSFE